MRCELCGVNTKCSCRWWGCPVCGMNNRQVTIQNDILKMGLSKDVLREKADIVKRWYNKIDCATLFEYLNWDITEEKFLEEVQNYKPVEQVARNLKEPFKTLSTPNPKDNHEFDWTSPRSHCIYCWVVAKYWKWKPCSRYIWNIKEEEKENNEEKS